MASDSSRSSWALFAGGIALGSAVAAGAAYAATSYYLKQQELALQQQLQQQHLQVATKQQRWASQRTNFMFVVPRPAKK
jgi:NADP-dependent 3-hydroxy acid dehydrogenase YdfG